MRPIDANALFSEISKWPESVMYKDWVQSAIANAPTIAPPPNEPLALEQLLEMDGEPVWIVTNDVKKANRWAFVDVGCEVIRFFDTRCGVKCPVMGNLFRTYGKTWMAYRRKPEEGVT